MSDVLTNSPWADRPGTDLASVRAEAERVQHSAERLRAIRVIAATAHDTREAIALIAMLGLDIDDDVRAAKARRSAAA
jgi:hypothetical protein